jgi:hypothetical protein
VSADGRPVPRAAKALSILLALLAPARMAWIVFTYGENNLSNDYIGRIGVVAAILEQRYDFRHLFTDTFITYGHSWLALLPLYWFDARFFGWNMSVELGVGLTFAAVKTLLIWLALCPSLSTRARWVLLPALSALGFAAPQVTSFTFGESTLQMQLPQVGLALGALAIARFSKRPNLRVALVAAGGLLASWSWGGGVMVWPVFFGALLAVGERRILQWAALSLMAALGLSQYVWILVFHPAAQQLVRPGLRHPSRFLDLLGRPLVNDTGRDLALQPSAVGFAAAGLVLAAAALWLARRQLTRRLPSLVLLGWALLVALEIGYFRSGPAPWYIVSMTVFWMALAGLLAAAPRPLSIIGYATIAAGLLFSNRTWEDKQFYLPSRAPASAACLREWRTHAVACHDRLFQWGGLNLGEAAVLGEPLERLHLSVFSSRRTYLLQGDLAVGRVGIENPKATAFLSRDGRTPGDPNDFRRLDLVLGPDAAVTWRVDVPPNLKSARFETRVRASRDDASLARGARVTTVGGSVEPVEARVLVPAGSDEPLALDLGAFAGKTVTLRLTAEEAEGGRPMIFEAPRVELSLESGQNRRAP